MNQFAEHLGIIALLDNVVVFILTRTQPRPARSMETARKIGVMYQTPIKGIIFLAHSVSK